MADNEKIDLYKKHKDLYVEAKKPVLVTIGPATYLAIVGRGAPGGEAFTTRIGALMTGIHSLLVRTRKEIRYTFAAQIWVRLGRDD